MSPNRNYNDPTYKAWRKSVHKRDKGKCQWPSCNSKCHLQCHHIKTWSEYSSLRFSTENGILLCKRHHKQIKGIEHQYESLFFSIAAKNALEQKLGDKAEAIQRELQKIRKEIKKYDS